MHPALVHFMVALPIVVLLLEIINLMTKKRVLGVSAFFLLALTVIVAIFVYITGTIDGKEASQFLNETVMDELKSHKLLGLYLMLASVVVLLFKLLAAVTKKGLIRALYMLMLTLFVMAILKQGKEGGELVYTYGVNVQAVQKSTDVERDEKQKVSDEVQEKVPEAEEKKSETLSQEEPKSQSSETTLQNGEAVSEEKIKPEEKNSTKEEVVSEAHLEVKTVEESIEASQSALPETNTSAH
jgi:uncharacterized membrane protein